MPIKIRLMKETDLPQLAKSYVAAYDALEVHEHWTHESAKRLLKYWMKKQPDLCFVAEIKGDLAGAFVSGIKPWWDGNHLFDGELFVDKKYQKRGVGAKLMKVLFAKATKKYFAITFEATTLNKNEFPLTWYKRIGILPCKELTFISGNLKTVLDRL
jgi:GNAT superfamily N-acetyltransferase